jgi:hypothetical protein
MTTNAPWTSTVARVGTGNIWQPNEGGTFALPTAAAPYLASGPAVAFDPRQGITRGLVATGVTGGAGVTLTVRGYDVFGQAMSENIVVAAGANTVYGIKAWKYITSVTPSATDAHAYSLGTSDVLGFNSKAVQIENTEVWWAAALNTAATGFIAGLVAKTTSTATTADVRGTMQLSAIGGGSGIGATATNGTSTGSGATLAFSGNVVSLMVRNAPQELFFATPVSAATLLGQAQFAN